MQRTEEKFPFFDYFCLTNLSIIVSSIMIVICVYITVSFLLNLKLVNGVIKQTFTNGYTLIGVIITSIVISPTFYYFFKYRDSPEVDNPYKFDLTQDVMNDIQMKDHMMMKLKERGEALEMKLIDQSGSQH